MTLRSVAVGAATVPYLDVEFESLLDDIEKLEAGAADSVQKAETATPEFESVLESLCGLILRTSFVFERVRATYRNDYDERRVQHFVGLARKAVHLAENSSQKHFERYLRKQADAIEQLSATEVPA